ncbi:NHL domain-containing thioredoxin family protein [Thalassiella azotivora]
MTSPTPSTRTARVRAPELAGRGWLNTGGEALTLAGLRGRFVLLDFWTFCCVNCLHVLDELRPLEEALADVLVTIGVHSPKFEHEADPDALAAAVERYEVHHPVLDDPELRTWQAYAARAWPTLVLVDPEGYVVAQLSGEGHVHGLRSLLTELVAEHEAKGTLRRGDAPFVPPPAPDTALRFPGKVVPLPTGTVLVTDTAHHQLVELEADLVTERRRIGSGERGLVDGDGATARFSEPQGLTLLPEDVAARVGYDVVVADSVNHALRGVRLDDGSVRTVAGTGTQLRRREGGGPALQQDLSTPWDVVWHNGSEQGEPADGGAVVVAMAGVHQLWTFVPAADPADGLVAVLAGTTEEGLRDGPAEEATLAQTSGLLSGGDGVLWFVDSETSALRRLSPEPDGGQRVDTVVGTGLFDFGHVDGPVGDARLQHPLGLCELPDGSVAVADTYNGAIRRYDRASGEVSTVADGLAEPSDVVVEHTDDGPLLLVVESAAHRLTRVPVPAEARHVQGEAMRTQRPPTDVAPGPLRLEVAFTPPTGQKLDDRWGDPTRLVVSATPPELLTSGAGSAQGLVRELVVSAGSGSGSDDGVGAADGVLHVSVQAAACDGDPVTGEVPEHAACHLYQQDWGIPVRVVEGGADVLRLDLRGV